MAQSIYTRAKELIERLEEIDRKKEELNTIVPKLRDVVFENHQQCLKNGGHIFLKHPNDWGLPCVKGWHRDFGERGSPCACCGYKCRHFLMDTTFSEEDFEGDIPEEKEALREKAKNDARLLHEAILDVKAKEEAWTRAAEALKKELYGICLLIKETSELIGDRMGRAQIPNGYHNCVECDRPTSVYRDSEDWRD